MSHNHHWAEQYVGIPCGSEAGFDCADLAALVQRECFENDIHLPRDRTYRERKGHAKFKAMKQQIEVLKDSYAHRTDAPIEGDPVLLKTKGYFQHIGVFCLIAGEPWILHAADGAQQVVLTRMRDLEIRGLFVEGYYKWN